MNNTIVYLTVGTLTGKKIAEEKLNADYVSYLPFDFLPTMLLAYNRIKPTSLIIVEADFWPNLIMLSKLKKIPAYVINARMKKKSAKKYMRIKFFFKPLLNIFKTIFVQSEFDKTMFEKLIWRKGGGTVPFALKKREYAKKQYEKLLGHSTGRTAGGADIRVLGDLKAYNVLKKYEAAHSCNRSQSLDTSPFAKASGDTRDDPPNPQQHNSKNNFTLLVGSLHPGELDVYLNLFKHLTKKYSEKNLKLILAPRHFHWKNELIRKVKDSGYKIDVLDENNSYNRSRSLDTSPFAKASGDTRDDPPDFCSPHSAEIVLILTLGTLFDLYKEADIYFLGGTFVPIGGHNLLEPAVWEITTIVGPYHENCHVIVDELKKCNGILVAKDYQDLTLKTEKIIKNKSDNFGPNARNWLIQEAGKVKRELGSFINNF